MIVKMSCCRCCRLLHAFSTSSFFLSLISFIRPYLLTIFSHEKSLMPPHQSVSGSWHRQFACALCTVQCKAWCTCFHAESQTSYLCEMDFILHVFQPNEIEFVLLPWFPFLCAFALAGDLCFALMWWTRSVSAMHGALSSISIENLLHSNESFLLDSVVLHVNSP